MMRSSISFAALKRKASSALGILSTVNFSKKESAVWLKDENKKMQMKIKNLFKASLIGLLLVIITNCTRSPEVLEIKDAHLYVPLNGSMMTGGYLSVSNITTEPIEILEINCSPYRAEIHETKMDEKGMMKMERLQSLELNPGSKIIFVPGGKHIMFWGLSDFQETYLDCSFKLKDKDSIMFKFEVLKRG